MFDQIELIKSRGLNIYLNYKYNQILTCGKGCRFNGISTITGGKNVEIGNNVHIGTGAFFRGEGGLKIGDNTHISRNVIIYTHNHNYNGDLLPYDSSFIYREVIIKKNVWIGTNVIILPGTVIGEGVIIGAGSVVSGNIEKLSVIGTGLAKTLKYRNKEHYEQLESNKKYGGINGKPLTYEE